MRGNNAQIALPAVLLIGGIIIELGIAGAFIAYLLSSTVFTEKLSNRALAAAKAGIDEAFLRIAENKDYTCTDSSISTGLAQVTISIEENPSGYPVGTRKIISVGKAFNRERKLQAIVSVSPLGKVNLVKLEEK